MKRAADAETSGCCQGAADHEEWCYRFTARQHGRSDVDSERKTSRRLARRVKLARRAAWRRERALLEARARILVEESQRVQEPPSRINQALQHVAERVNEALQTPEAWAAVWSEDKP